MNHISGLELIQKLYPGVLRLKIDQVSVLINRKPQTIRNQISKNKFAIPSILDGSSRFFDIRNVADFIDRPHELQNKKVKRGRPTKKTKLSVMTVVQGEFHE